MGGVEAANPQTIRGSERLLAAAVGVVLAIGAYVELFVVALQVSDDACGYLAESPCDLSFTPAALISIVGLLLTLTATFTAFMCAFTGRRGFWRASLYLVVATVIVALVLVAIDPFD